MHEQVHRALRLAALGAGLLAAGTAAGLYLAETRPGSRPALPAAPFSFAPLVRRVAPAVVNIAVTETAGPSEAAPPAPPRGTPLERPYRHLRRERREPVLGAGSGFVIDPSGVIVTNNHVVGHAEKIVVSLADGRELPARLLGADELTDLAVIAVSTSRPLPFVSWGDSRSIEVGDWIMAAGNPFGLGSSITAGIVSARGRDIGSGPFDDFIQLDAPINPGNSGGPTFNLSGEVVAVNTAIVSPTGGSVGIAFAIPSELARHIVADLRGKGRIERGWLGVSVQDGPAGGAGVDVAAIDRAGPAGRAGLRPGDVVLAVNGERVESARELIRAIAAAPPGASLILMLRRHDRTLPLPVTVGRRPPDETG